MVTKIYNIFFCGFFVTLIFSNRNGSFISDSDIEDIFIL